MYSKSLIAKGSSPTMPTLASSALSTPHSQPWTTTLSGYTARWVNSTGQP